MTIWTIDAEPGAGGCEVARRLAKRARVPLVDGWLTTALALEFGTTIGDTQLMEEVASSRLVRCGLAVGLTTRLAPELAHELELRGRCRAALELAVQEAARAPCVILGHCAYAALADHPGVLHVRIRAPRKWRVRQLAADRVLPLPRAGREIDRADRRQRHAARRIFDRRAGDPASFHVVCDASRLAVDTIVDLLLLLGGRSVDAAARTLLHAR